MDLPFTCGIELEFSTPPHNAENVTYHGVPCTEVPGLLKTDSSCGFEIVSPILSTDESLTHWCKTAGTFLRGKTVTKKCGTHIHLGINYGNTETVVRLLKGLYRYENAYFSLVPPHRQINSYCARFSETGLVRTESYLEKLGDRSQSSKYEWASIHTRYPTIEYRLQEGFKKSHDIYCWAWFLMLVQKALIEVHNPIARKSKSPTYNQIHNLLIRSGFYGKDAHPKASVVSRWVHARYARVNGAFFRSRHPRKQKRTVRNHAGNAQTSNPPMVVPSVRVSTEWDVEPTVPPVVPTAWLPQVEWAANERDRLIILEPSVLEPPVPEQETETESTAPTWTWGQTATEGFSDPPF